MTPLDSFVKRYDWVPDVIKIDTEGYEFDILKGGTQFLKKHGPLIFLEVHPLHLRKLGISLAQLRDLIFFLGYEIYDLFLTVPFPKVSGSLLFNPASAQGAVLAQKAQVHFDIFYRPLGLEMVRSITRLYLQVPSLQRHS